MTSESLEARIERHFAAGAAAVGDAAAMDAFLELRGALEAESKVGLKMNLQEKDLASLLKTLPALRNPTISNLSQTGWVAVETIIDQKVVRELIPQLKAAGAEGIIEYPLNKVVY